MMPLEKLGFTPSSLRRIADLRFDVVAITCMLAYVFSPEILVSFGVTLDMKLLYSLVLYKFREDRLVILSHNT